MQIPYTSNKILFWLDPDAKFVTLNASNKVTSMYNRAGCNGRNLMYPNTAAGLTGPTWVDNALNGFPVLSFDGTQGLLFDMLDNAAPMGNNKPFMMTTVVQTLVFDAAKSKSIFFIGNKTSSNPDQAIYCSNQTSVNTYGHQRINNALQVVGFSPGPYASDFGYHVVTSSFDGVYLIFRVDGVELNRINASAFVNPVSMNQVAIGYIPPTKIPTIGTFINPFIGNMATAIAYIGDYGTSIDYSIESYLMNYYGIPAR